MFMEFNTDVVITLVQSENYRHKTTNIDSQGSQKGAGTN